MGIITWTESVLEDLKEIKSFIAHDSKQFANYLLIDYFKHLKF